jgi:hypothetical protein
MKLGAALVALTLAAAAPASAFSPKKGKWVGKTAQGERIEFKVANKVPCGGVPTPGEGIPPPGFCKTKWPVVQTGGFDADCPLPGQPTEWGAGWTLFGEPDNNNDDGVVHARGFQVTFFRLNTEAFAYPDDPNAYEVDFEWGVFGTFKKKRKAKGLFDYSVDYASTQTVDGRPLTDCNVETRWKAKRK